MSDKLHAAFWMSTLFGLCALLTYCIQHRVGV